ncbi:hypothetical protein [Streptomyces sp. NPDC057740]
MTASTTFRIGGDLQVRRLGFGAMRLRPSPDEQAHATHPQTAPASAT